jgi:hypothetical protein
LWRKAPDPLLLKLDLIKQFLVLIRLQELSSDPERDLGDFFEALKGKWFTHLPMLSVDAGF